MSYFRFIEHQNLRNIIYKRLHLLGTFPRGPLFAPEPHWTGDHWPAVVEILNTPLESRILSIV